MDSRLQPSVYGEHEIRLLLLAQDHEIVERMLTAPKGASWEWFSEPLVSELIFQGGLKRSEAIWAVHTWAEILTRISESGSQAPAVPQALLGSTLMRIDRSRRQAVRGAIREGVVGSIWFILALPLVVMLGGRGIVAMALLIVIALIVLAAFLLATTRKTDRRGDRLTGCRSA
jgi:hypothetical protein